MSRCLLLVDIQNDYFPGGRMELVGMDAAAANARQALDAFRGAGAHLVHVQHISTRSGAGFFLPDTAGVEISESVCPEAGETVVTKHFPNAFRDTALAGLLRERDVDELVICGAMSHMCIDATTRAAFDLGFRCTVLEDACATRDLSWHGAMVPAAEVHAAFMAALAAPFARVIATSDLKPPDSSPGG